MRPLAARVQKYLAVARRPETDLPLKMLPDMQLHRRVQRQMLADFAEHLVPRPAHVTEQVASQRRQVLVEMLRKADVLPRPPYALASRPLFDLKPPKSPVAGARKVYSAAPPRTLDDHFGHIRSHSITTFKNDSPNHGCKFQKPAWSGFGRPRAA